MNNIRKLGVTFLMILTLFACSDLDINVNPDTPTSALGGPETNLPAMQFFMGHIHGTTGFFTALINQQITLSNRGDRYGSLAEWTANNNTCSVYPYQIFFIGAGGSFQDLYVKAQNEGAYHYMAVVKLFRAAGFMIMADVYGEMPYTEALGEKLNPIFDDGKTIFEGCLKEVDEAIELFKKTQEPGATPLSAGDSWNGGDVSKWIKLCYGLKARWLNNLSKKTDLYDPDEILACLDNAPKSNSESTVINHEFGDGSNVDNIWGDPVAASYAYIWLVNWSRVYYPTKWYVDLLTNFDGRGVVDPRANKLVPMAQSGVTKQWFRTKGVNMQSNIRLSWIPSGTYNAVTKKWTGDSTVISYTAEGPANPSFKSAADDGTIVNSGTFYVRPDGPTHLLAYPEMCFIKAEILFRKGDKPGAFTAYKDGIKAHMDLMNEKLNVWNDPVNISKQPISQADITNYLNSVAVGTADNLTMGKIMMQKFIALSFSNQNWNDMRRFDYSPDIYKNWAEPFERTSGANDKKWIPSGKQFRRFRQSSLEINYNSDNVKTSHTKSLDDNIWSCPVWFDYPNDDYKTAQ